MRRRGFKTVLIVGGWLGDLPNRRRTIPNAARGGYEIETFVCTR